MTSEWEGCYERYDTRLNADTPFAIRESVTPVGNKSLTVLDALTFSSSPLSAAQLSYPLKLTQPTIYRVSYLNAVAGVSRAMGGAAPARPRPGSM